jgi:hypothetical protein
LNGDYPITFTATNPFGTTTQGFTLHVYQPPFFTSVATATFPINQFSTFTITTGGFPAATVTEAGALPTGVNFDGPTGTGTATLSGTPTVSGDFPITLTASNGVNPDATQNFDLIVTAPPTIVNPPTGIIITVGVNNPPVTFVGTGFPPPTWTVTGGTLPPGTGLDPITGVFSGAPIQGGSFPITVTATNPSGSTSVGVIITVNQPPVFTVGTTATLPVGVPSTFIFTTNAYPPPTFTLTSGSLPPGTTLNTTTGGLEGTPTVGGIYPIVITASNGIGPPVSLTFTLTITQPPAITSNDTVTWLAGTVNSFPVTSTGFPIPTLGEVGALPNGVSFTVDPAGNTGVLDGTAAVPVGTYTFTFTATNGVTPDASQLFTLKVVSSVAITSANNTTFLANQPNTFTVTTSGTPTPTVSEAGALPGGVTFDPVTDVLSGTPALGTGGVYPITFTASNGGSPVTQDFTLTVDQAPVFTNSTTTASVLVGKPLPALSFAASGFPTPITLGEVGALPSGVTFDAAAGTLVGTPTQTGVFAISVTATNSVGTAKEAFVLSVVAASNPPGGGSGSGGGGSKNSATSFLQFLFNLLEQELALLTTITTDFFAAFDRSANTVRI